MFKNNMPQKFKNKYRTESCRHKLHDYSGTASYFITISTKNKEHFFGKIKNGKMEYSNLGLIAKKCWQEIPQHFNNVRLDEFVIMPNHTHGIIHFHKTKLYPVETQNLVSLLSQPVSLLSKPVAFSLQPVSSSQPASSPQYQPQQNKFGPQSQNLASMIRGFKIGVTKYARNNTQINTVWQRLYHDRIIRNDYEYNHIKQYIINNPKKWESDCFYK